MLLSEEGFREDGRLPEELRRVEIVRRRVGDGGGMSLRQGNTQVSAVCRGTEEQGRLGVKVCFYGVARQEPVNEKRVLEYEDLLCDVFGSIVLPENAVDVDVVVREDGGSLLSAMINCVSLCLAQYGVPMTDMCCSATVAEDCVDLSNGEDGHKFSVMVLGYLVNRRTIAYLSVNGRMAQHTVATNLTRGVGCCEVLYEQFRAFLASSNK